MLLGGASKFPGGAAAPLRLLLYGLTLAAGGDVKAGAELAGGE